LRNIKRYIAVIVNNYYEGNGLYSGDGNKVCVPY
jgi:hypothetical protein